MHSDRCRAYFELGPQVNFYYFSTLRSISSRVREKTAETPRKMDARSPGDSYFLGGAWEGCDLCIEMRA